VRIVEVPFRQADVDYLLRARKYISSIPTIHENEFEYSIKANVKRIDDPGRELGLTVLAHVKRPLPGLPRNFPACALQWHGYRIRGVNWHVYFENDDGTIIKGWHEHIWHDKERDGCVIEAIPPVGQPTLLKLFEWGLSQWKIEVREGGASWLS
jgi:hypothetical protein